MDTSISKQKLKQGEHFTIKCSVVCGEYDLLEIIGVKKFKNPISESDLTFPNAQTFFKLTERLSETQLQHDFKFVAYVIRIRFSGTFAFFRVHFVSNLTGP